MKLIQLKNKCTITSIVLVLILKYASSTQLPGEIHPPNVEIEVGDSVNITCQLNPFILKDYNASDLRFVNEDTQLPIPDEDVVMVNSTTIMYMLRNAKEQLTSLLCKCGNNGIMISKIYVGYKPLPVKDLNCRSYDFEYMTCNFTQPVNPVITNYNLAYYVDTPQYKYYPECVNDGKQHITCNTTLKNQAQYHFMLFGTNELGSNMETFTFNNWEIMEPAVPGENIRVINVSNNSLHIAWRMPKWDKYRAKGLRWEILIKPDNFPILNLSNAVQVTRIRGEMNLKLTDLPYSWYWYDLNLRVRINLPNAPWSRNFVYRFRTTATRPVVAPRIQPGCFYIDSTETQIRLYWEQLKQYEQNGDNFTYVISNVKKDGHVIEQQPVLLETNSATFLWQKNAKYEFEIHSSNIMGKSLESSHLIINPLTTRNAKRHTPRAIQNVYHATNGTYTLTWQPPAEQEQLKDYTVYWCYSKRALQNECKGSIHFANVASDVHKFTTAQQEHTLNLAVSANYIDYNTGMHWTDCSQDVNSDLVKMEPEIQALSATSLKIQWSPEGVCPSILIGYNLTYCEVLNESSGICLNQTVIEIDSNAKKYELIGLKPYTYYKIEMLMYSPFKVGKISDSQLVRTFEAAPTAPRQLQLLHIGNVSATITWLPPSHPNGVLRSYTINLNDKKFELDIDGAAEPFAKVSFLLTNLSSFTVYKVYVVAHNSLTSKPSNDIHFTTLIGFPSKPDTAYYKHGNNTVIKWSKPLAQSGRLEYYEVAITQLRNDVQVKRYVNYIISSTECLLRQLPICPSSDYKTTVQVRAVNAALLSHEVDMKDNSYETAPQPTDYIDIEQDSEDYLHCDNVNARDAAQTNELLQRYQNNNIYRLYKSEWQMGPTYSCSANRYNKVTTIAFAIIVFVVALMIAVYVAGKKYKKMANIHCTLPEGLESYFEKDLCSNAGSSAAIINDALSYSHTDFVKSVLDCDDDFNLHDRAPHEQQQQHKYLMQHEQEQHLLEASIGNDSGYLGDLRAFDSCVQHMKQPKQQQNSTKQHNDFDLMKSTSIDSLVDSTLSSSNENLAQFSPLNINKQTTNAAIVGVGGGGGGGYIKPENLFNWPQQQPTKQALLNNCDYITVDAIKAIQTQPIKAPLPPPPSNFGYVHPSQLQKLTQNEPINNVPLVGNNMSNNLSGYTTLAQLEHAKKLACIVPANAINSSLQQQQSTPQPPSVASGQISGYVTQSDLNMFAHNQHNQQSTQQQQHEV